MAEICCEVSEGSRGGSSNSRAARRRRMDLRRVSLTDDGLGVVKRPRMEDYESEPRVILRPENGGDIHPATALLRSTSNLSPLTLKTSSSAGDGDTPTPKFGIASVCGRRRDMEDAVAIQPLFCRTENETNNGGLHYFGVYDGHGCSHVATKCRERLHEVVKEELVMKKHEEDDDGWKSVMERSFNRMDKEVVAWNENVMDNMSVNCRCELQSPECDAVGSTAVVAVVSPDRIVVANCGDSRAVLCRNGRALPLSTDHKPDRPDELNRIQAAGGRVIYWEGARVLGVLAMSRAIGDNYLKPYVSCEPEVSITERSEEDECLILASDGLWDVVSNETACGVARMCLRAAPTLDSESDNADRSDKACNDASMLLTKLALARRSADNVSVVVIDLRKPTSAFL